MKKRKIEKRDQIVKVGLSYYNFKLNINERIARKSIFFQAKSNAKEMSR